MIRKDFIVVGGGGAGLSAGFTAAGFGKKTLLIEKDKIGGECTWSGCIPSKALLHLAEMHHNARKLGLDPPAPQDIFEKTAAVSQGVYAHETPEVLAERGVEVIQGEARFLDRKTLQVGEETYQAKKYVLALGSQPCLPPLEGLDNTPFLTNQNLFAQKEIPASLLVLGGGAAGLEMAQAMNRLGCKTTLVEGKDRILPREDPQIAQIIHQALETEGVVLKTAACGVEVQPVPGGGVSLTIESPGKREHLQAQKLLVAAGRTPVTQGINLPAAGVETGPGGLKLNRKLRTTNPRIYAAGDLAGPHAFSHMAEYQGVLAAMNALLPFQRNARYTHAVWAGFTDPEIAAAGLQEEEARRLGGRGVRTYTHRFEDLDRGRTAPGTKGLVKIIVNAKGRILGAHIAGPRAGDLIGEIQALKTLNIPFYKLQKVIHPYPSYADILRQTAKKMALDRILNHPLVKFIRFLTRRKNGE